jgi:hypothetical protein
MKSKTNLNPIQLGSRSLKLWVSSNLNSLNRDKDSNPEKTKKKRSNPSWLVPE